MSSEHFKEIDLSAMNESSQKDLSEKIKILYKSAFYNVRNFIIKNSGNSEDARDIFQEAVLVYLKNIQQAEFKLTSTEQNYIMGISRNIWYKHLRDKKTVTINDDDWVNRIEEKSAFENTELIEKDFLMDMVTNKLNEISKECRDIIFHAFYQKKSSVEIAHLTGYSEQFIKVKKHRCLQGLKKLITNSDDFKNLGKIF